MTSSSVRGLSRSPKLAPRGVEDVYTCVGWKVCDAKIESSGGVVFSQKGVEAPSSWSDRAVSIVASKYFAGSKEEGTREWSVRSMINRVVDGIVTSGVEQSYFKSRSEAEPFRKDLIWLLLTQRAAFNSPVYFNVGLMEKPQTSACFIGHVEDDLDSILDLAKLEARIFKRGSGCGVNLSNLRSSKETIGDSDTKSSGPVSFMQIFDRGAEVIKSGQRARRAAKMVILDADHPDIIEFIRCKVEEEKKARVLLEAGYSGGMNGEAYSSVFFQNANHSVRISDEIMDSEKYWVKDRFGNPIIEMSTAEVLDEIARSAWACGDPGVQFDSTIQRMNPCKDTDRIRGSNPCSEFMFLDMTSCNLASINLLKYWDGERFLVDEFIATCEVLILAQDILVEMSGYPDPRIERMSHDYRPLGLGYANLGALLMSQGIPYDSEEGRAICGFVTSLMSAAAFRTSCKIAEKKGAYKGLSVGENTRHQLEVINRHADASFSLEVPLETDKVWRRVHEVANDIWGEVKAYYPEHGLRNAQLTLLAPTGTIGLMMDCDTLGIEPEISLVKYKKLHGGGMMKMVNNQVRPALLSLGYEEGEITKILEHVDRTGSVEGSSLKEEHLSVFDCSMRSRSGTRTISPMGHVRMMAAAQPFLSGAISKTVNLPNDVTVDDIKNLYYEAWRSGLKAIAVYRDGCKAIEPYSGRDNSESGRTKDMKVTKVVVESGSKEEAVPHIQRRRIPDDSRANRHRFVINDPETGGVYKGYIHVGLYEDGSPGELFIRMAKEGSTVSGLLDGFSIAVSLALQWGMPLKDLVCKLRDMKFSPAGRNPEASDPHLRVCSSILDYVARYFEITYLQDNNSSDIQSHMGHGPACAKCGGVTTRDGKCHVCMNCGTMVGACTG